MRPVWIAGGHGDVRLPSWGWPFWTTGASASGNTWNGLQQVNDWQQARCSRPGRRFRFRRSRCLRSTRRLPRTWICSVAPRCFIWSTWRTRCAASRCCGIGFCEPATPREIRTGRRRSGNWRRCFELREELALRGHALAGSLAGPDAFVTWAESAPYLAAAAVGQVGLAPAAARRAACRPGPGHRSCCRPTPVA